MVGRQKNAEEHSQQATFWRDQSVRGPRGGRRSQKGLVGEVTQAAQGGFVVDLASAGSVIVWEESCVGRWNSCEGRALDFEREGRHSDAIPVRELLEASLIGIPTGSRPALSPEQRFKGRATSV